MVEDRITIVDHLLVTVCQRTIDGLAIESGGKPDIELFRLGVKPCAPQGSPSGDGGYAHPWYLATSLAQPAHAPLSSHFIDLKN
jgi:hypothetical protein